MHSREKYGILVFQGEVDECLKKSMSPEDRQLEKDYGADVGNTRG